jgi:zinc/manganese transport system substrate-binding protein
MNPNAVWAAAVLPIVASTGILSDLVKTAGGDQVQVTCLATSTLDPHLYSGRNDYGSALNQAELLVQNGLAYENTWLPVLLTKANNPKIAAQGTGVFDASEGMTLLDPPKKEGARAWADLHPMGDPHYLMDPRNAVKVLRTLGVKLGELRPEQKAYFAVQSEKAARQLEAKIRGWQKRIKPLEGKSFVSYHPSLNYFGAWLGMRPEGVLSLARDSPPSPPF